MRPSLFSDVKQCRLVVSYQLNCLTVTSKNSKYKISSNTQTHILIIFMLHVTHKYLCSQSFLLCLIRPDLISCKVALTLHELWSKSDLLGGSMLAPWQNQLNLTAKCRLCEKMKGLSQHLVSYLPLLPGLHGYPSRTPVDTWNPQVPVLGWSRGSSRNHYPWWQLLSTALIWKI